MKVNAIFFVVVCALSAAPSLVAKKLVRDREKSLSVAVSSKGYGAVQPGSPFTQNVSTIPSTEEPLNVLFEDLNNIMIQSHDSTTEGTVGGSESDNARAKQVHFYNQLAKERKPSTVCETGFNGGQSALRFLAQTDAQVYEFDFGEHSYAKKAESFLNERFPGRLHVTWGDSTQTLPQFRKDHPGVTCDVIIVDGGHSTEVAASDIENFAQMASKNHVLVVDDTPCSQWWCAGPTEAWNAFTKKGCLKELRAVEMTPATGFRAGLFLPCKDMDLARQGWVHIHKTMLIWMILITAFGMLALWASYRVFKLRYPKRVT